MSAVCYRAIGLMSGTSMDGIDVAAIETDGQSVLWAGPGMTFPYEPEDRARLALAIRNPEMDVTTLEADLTDRHIAAVKAYLATLPHDKRHLDVVGMHGHTLIHKPDQHFTRQLGDAAKLSAALGVDTVFDFRSNDMAAGGEGAPLAPVYHQALARALPQPVVFVNIGGVSNITYVNGDEMLAFDTGPGNALIDDWVEAHTGQSYDKDGAIAARGTPDAAVLKTLLGHPYFSKKPPKSLDRLDFSSAPVEGLNLEDGAATLTAFTADAIALSVRHMAGTPLRWLVTGGGRHNSTLMAMLDKALPGAVEPIEAIGADGDALEAQAFALMAVRRLLDLPISFPGTTGVPRPLCGGRLVSAAGAQN